jgi:hypothetical protein
MERIGTIAEEKMIDAKGMCLEGVKKTVTIGSVIGKRIHSRI